MIDTLSSENGCVFLWKLCNVFWALRKRITFIDDIDEGFASNRSNSSSASPEESKRKIVPKLIVSATSSEKERFEIEPFSEEALIKQSKDVAKSTLQLVLDELNDEEGVNIELVSDKKWKSKMSTFN